MCVFETCITRPPPALPALASSLEMGNDPRCLGSLLFGFCRKRLDWFGYKTASDVFLHCSTADSIGNHIAQNTTIKLKGQVICLKLNYTQLFSDNNDDFWLGTQGNKLWVRGPNGSRDGTEPSLFGFGSHL